MLEGSVIRARSPASRAWTMITDPSSIRSVLLVVKELAPVGHPLSQCERYNNYKLSFTSTEAMAVE